MSITMFCGTDSIPWNILGYFPHPIWKIPRILYGVLSFPQNIVMDLNIVMKALLSAQLIAY